MTSRVQVDEDKDSFNVFAYLKVAVCETRALFEGFRRILCPVDNQRYLLVAKAPAGQSVFRSS